MADISKKLNYGGPYVHLTTVSDLSNKNETISGESSRQAYSPSNSLGGVNCEIIFNSNALNTADVAESPLDHGYTYDGCEKDISLQVYPPSNSLEGANCEGIFNPNALSGTNVAESMSDNSYTYDGGEQDISESSSEETLLQADLLSNSLGGENGDNDDFCGKKISEVSLDSGTVLYDFEVLNDGELMHISCQNINEINHNGCLLQLNNDGSICLNFNSANDIISETPIVDANEQKSTNSADTFFKEPHITGTPINNCKYLISIIIKISVW